LLKHEEQSIFAGPVHRLHDLWHAISDLKLYVAYANILKWWSSKNSLLDKEGLCQEEFDWILWSQLEVSKFDL
jgi:hypothetical protein